MARVHNFNPGPAALPLAVLDKIREDLPVYGNTGMSILEISHRSAEFIEILRNTKATLRELMAIPEDYELLFLGGGASLQFSMLAMNFLASSQSADYVVTGSWSQKAVKEARLIGEVNVAASSEDEKFSYIPSQWNFSTQAQYVHITSNNTIFGTQWREFPDTGEIPCFVDMSSDILSRRVDVGKFSLIYAGAQKNAGPAGVTLVILKKSLLERARQDIPVILRYKTHVDKDSSYNTPPVFQIYVMGLVANWIKENGGLAAIEEINQRKSDLLYAAIDKNPDFFRGTAKKDSRSQMNATFRLPSEELEKKFAAQATESGFCGLKGHRSAGGIRVSMYNAISVQAVEELTKFMAEFAAKNG